MDARCAAGGTAAVLRGLPVGPKVDRGTSPGTSLLVAVAPSPWTGAISCLGKSRLAGRTTDASAALVDAGFSLGSALGGSMRANASSAVCASCAAGVDAASMEAATSSSCCPVPQGRASASCSSSWTCSAGVPAPLPLEARSSTLFKGSPFARIRAGGLRPSSSESTRFAAFAKRWRFLRPCVSASCSA